MSTGWKPPIPPHDLYGDFLAPDEHRALLAWAASSDDLLRPSRTFRGIDPHHRQSMSLKLTSAENIGNPALAPWRELLSRRLQRALPQLFGMAGMQPFPVSRIELELVVYRNGAHFRRHTDTKRLGEPATEDRLITGVYYFFNEPKAFSGGALRLHRFGVSDPGPEDYAEIEPQQNSLLVFPSWSVHEVTPVSTPSGRLADARFAVNCWINRERAAE